MQNNKKIKVCHFSSVHSIYDTRVFDRECVWLAKDFDVTLIAIGNFTGEKKNVNIIGIKKTKKPKYRFLSTIWIVFAKAIKTNSQIYHVHDAEMLPFALLLRLFGKKVIYDIHENTKADILYKNWIPQWQKKIIIILYDIVLKSASRFLYMVPVVWKKDDIKKFYCKTNQYTIVQNFADVNELRKYRVGNRDKLPLNNLFYVGMIKDNYYDIYKLFDAMLLLKSEGIETHLHCIGYFGIGQEQDFNDYNQWNVVKDMITYYGKLHYSEAYNISMNCKVGICLKNQPDGMVLSHERKLFEYIAIGLPAIFCNASIYKDISTNYNIGEYCNLNEPNDIKEKLKDLLTNKKKYTDIINQQINISNSWMNWELEYDKLKNFYIELIKFQFEMN